MKKFFAVAALILGVVVSQIVVPSQAQSAGVRGTVWRCTQCKQEVKMPPYEHPDSNGYKHGCPAARFGDMHIWKSCGYHFSDGSVRYTD